MSGKFGLVIVMLAAAVLLASENQSLAGRRKGCASCSTGGCSTGACPTTACESGACPAPAAQAAAVPAAPESAPVAKADASSPATPVVTSAPAAERGYAVARRGARRGWRR
jgi:hypothetical protein